MSQKNETTVLVLALLITFGLLGAGLWWFSQRSGINLGSLTGSESNGSDASSTDLATGRPDLSEQPTEESFSQVQGVPSGLFNYGGSTTWAPIRRDLDPAIQTVFPGFNLRYTNPINEAPGSGTGIRMLLNNQLAFAQSSRSLQDEEYQQAQQRGFTLREIPVAIEGIAIAVNPNLNIPGLTLAQLKDIYTGRVTNWSQVGGPNLAITPYSRRIEDGGTVEFFVENILTGEDFGSNISFIPNTTQALREISTNPGGIYYASAPEVVAQCTVKSLPIGREADNLVPPYQLPFVPLSQCPNQRNQINSDALQSGEYPITRRLFVIVKQDGQVDEQAGEAYANLLLTNQGQSLLSELGFVRIR